MEGATLEHEGYTPESHHIEWFKMHVLEGVPVPQIAAQSRMTVEFVSQTIARVNRWYVLRYEKNKAEERARKLFVLDSLMNELHADFVADGADRPKIASQIRLLIREWMEIQGGHERVANAPGAGSGGNTTNIDKQITVLLQNVDDIDPRIVEAGRAMDAARDALKIAEPA